MKRERKNIATLKDIINISVEHKWNTASDKWASRALGGKAGRGDQESAFCVVTGEAGARSKGKGRAQAPWGRVSSLFTHVHTHTCTHTRAHTHIHPGREAKKSAALWTCGL